MKNGERAGKLDCWTKMPVHPESAMRGEESEWTDRHEGETDDSEATGAGKGSIGTRKTEHSRLNVKTWGVVIGRPELSRG